CFVRISSTLLSVALSLYTLFYNAPPPSDIPSLSLHDALPIYSSSSPLINSKIKTPIPYIKRDECAFVVPPSFSKNKNDLTSLSLDRKSTRLNSSHVSISYAVFCLKKKKL